MPPPAAYPILNPASPPDPATAALRANTCALAVMAKAPRPGKVKTRLSPPLSPDQSAALNICFLEDTTQNLADIAASHQAPAPGQASASHQAASHQAASHQAASHQAAPAHPAPAPAAGLISYTPVGEESLFDTLLPPAFALIPQRGDSFGERLLHAAEDILACGFASVCLIDSDSPTVPAAAFRQAVEALAAPGDRVVLGPSHDGGYYLIGLKHPHPQPFAHISWSTSTVAAETRERCREAGLPLVELPLWYDVDDRETLALLAAELLDATPPAFATSPGYPAPRTRAFLSELRRQGSTQP